jgi:hypothetical protein
VLAAHPIDLRAGGQGAPSGLRMIAGKEEKIAIVEIPEALARISPPELFRTHIVRGGRLVAKGVRRR